MERIDQKTKYKENNEEKNYANERCENGLTLRKRKINAILSKKRGFYKTQTEEDKDYQIMKESLNLPNEIKNKKYDDIDQFLKEMKTNITSKDIEYNKYALYCIRTQTLNNETSNNKNVLSELLLKQDFISDILNLIQKNLDNKQIIYEGLWILINVLFYQNDNTDLIIFLSNQQCIQLYIKILDKKDNCLRLNIYWLLSNILNNDNLGIIIQVLFQLYMSPLFRLYIFKDLEDNNSKLKLSELKYLMSILSRLSDFINETFIRLNNKNIKMYTDYNSNIDYDSIQENNNYLFYHSLKLFINYIEVSELTAYCIYGLSKLTNYLGDIKAYQDFFISGICRKLVKGQIKVEEELINYVVQIIGNFLFYSTDSLIDKIFLEETLAYFVKLIQTYPNRQYLKRDIFWSASNIVAGDKIFSELFAKSELLPLALQTIVSDNDLVINEALFLLSGFFDKQNIETIINYYHLDYIKSLVLCLKNIHSRSNPGVAYNNMDVVEKVLTCIGFLFEDGDLFKIEGNQFVKDFEKNGGFELLETMLSEKNLSQEVSQIAEALLSMQKNS
jgi:hypothetical protein